MKLERALGECTLSLLRGIAASHGIDAPDELLRSELAGRIVSFLEDPDYLSRYLLSLSPEERSLLQAVRDEGWVAKSFVLDRRFQQPGTGIGGRSAGPVRGPQASLVYKGLLFRGFATVGSWRGEVYYVPEEMRPAISELLPAPRPESRPDLRARGAPETVDQRDVLFELFCLFSLLRREDRRLVEGNLGRSDLAALEREVRAGSPLSSPERWEERWRFLIHLCISGGWLRRQGSFLKPSRSAARLLAGGPGEVQAGLLERYSRDRGWSDLAAAGRVRQLLGSRRIDEPTARRLLVHYLQDWASSDWVDEDAFCGALRSVNPDFLREDYSSPAWSMVSVDTGVELHGPDSWESVERGWIGYLLRGPLRWLGLVRWGLDGHGNAIGFRWQEPARGSGAGSLRAGSATRVRISLEGAADLTECERVDLAVLYRLEPYLELTRREGVRSYRLTAASAVDGVEKGGSWGELRELLAQCCDASLPPSAAARLKEWSARYGRWTVEVAILATAATAEEADLLGEQPEIGRCLEGRLGERSYRVVPERVRELVEGLRRLGQMPRVEAAVRAAGARAVVGDPELARECLFALMLLRSLHGTVGLKKGARTLARLEAALDPEDVGEIARRAEEVAATIQRFGGATRRG